MVESTNTIHQFAVQKYKVVEDPNSGAKWVKERDNPSNPNDKSSTRHQIQVGPRGGESFVNNNGKKVYV